jgi:hypothetical protein
VGQSHFSKSSCLGQRVRIPVPSCSTLPAIERRRICVVAAIVRWGARRWQEHGWANPPRIVCFRPKPGLAQKKIHSRSISATQLARFSCRSRKSSECSWTPTSPPSASCANKCAMHKPERAATRTGAFLSYTRPDKGLSTHAQRRHGVTSSLLPTASPEDCMLRKTQHKPDNVLR